MKSKPTEPEEEIHQCTLRDCKHIWVNNKVNRQPVVKDTEDLISTTNQLGLVTILNNGRLFILYKNSQHIYPNRP